eukprot:9111236-Heterocapsa_arctica.AAC.1
MACTQRMRGSRAHCEKSFHMHQRPVSRDDSRCHQSLPIGTPRSSSGSNSGSSLGGLGFPSSLGLSRGLSPEHKVYYSPGAL